MKSFLRTTSRGVAAGLAGVLVAGTAAVIAAPAQAQAVPASGALNWSISSTFANFDHQKLDGATFDEAKRQYAFPATSVESAAGTVTTSFSGSVEGGFKHPATGEVLYSVTVADPEIVLGADGTGEVRATVHSTGSNADATVKTEPTEVTVAEFTGASTENGVTSATPKWAGVLPAGSPEATALDLVTAGQPVDGKSFHPDFLGAIHKDVRAHFHFTRSGDVKAPAPFSFATKELTPTITPTVLLQDHEEGLSIKAAGSGFTAVTNPGDAGVYVGLVKAGTVIDYSDRSSMAAMPAVDYVLPGRFQGDRFTAMLNAPTEKLEIGADYVIVTWQAHTHSNTTQDTTTPVTIDWSKFVAPKVASKAVLKVTKKATLKKAGTATVTLTGASSKPTGNVAVTTKAPGIAKTAKKTVKVTNGRAVITLPKAKKGGSYTVTATYAGDKLHHGAAKQTQRFVVKAAAKTSVKVIKKATTKRAGKARITVTGKTTAGVAKARGKVKVTIQAPGKKVIKRTVTLKKSGKVVITLPKANKKGTYRVTAKYVGNKNYTSAKKKTVRHKVA